MSSPLFEAACNFRGRVGTLVLTSQGFSFQPEGSSIDPQPQVKYLPFSIITGTLLSTRKSTQHALKIVTKDEPYGIIFSLCSPNSQNELEELRSILESLNTTPGGNNNNQQQQPQPQPQQTQQQTNVNPLPTSTSTSIPIKQRQPQPQQAQEGTPSPTNGNPFPTIPQQRRSVELNSNPSSDSQSAKRMESMKIGNDTANPNVYARGNVFPKTNPFVNDTIYTHQDEISIIPLNPPQKPSPTSTMTTPTLVTTTHTTMQTNRINLEQQNQRKVVNPNQIQTTTNSFDNNMNTNNTTLTNNLNNLNNVNTNSIHPFYTNNPSNVYTNNLNNPTPNIVNSINNTNNNDNNNNNNNINSINNENVTPQRIPANNMTNFGISFTSLDEEGGGSENNSNDNGVSFLSSEKPFTVTVKEPFIPPPINSQNAAKQPPTTYLVLVVCEGEEVFHSRRRYSDFSWLHEQLVLLSNNSVNNNHSKMYVPSLPPKSSIVQNLPYLDYFSAKKNSSVEFIKERCMGLDRFLKQVANSPQLRNSVAFHAFFLEPFSRDPQSIWKTVGNIGRYVQDTTKASLETVVNVSKTTVNSIPQLQSSSSTILNRPTNNNTNATPVISISEVEQDYNELKGLMVHWQHVPSGLPFEKFMVTCLGTTSAGKSAFVNHFYGIHVKRSAVGQMDSNFTIIEVISQSEFARIAGDRYTPGLRLTKESLIEKISTDPHSDPRYGKVFVYLEPDRTLGRYTTQLGGFLTADLRSYGLISSILINEEFLSMTELDEVRQNLAKKTIIVDSPGFDASLQEEDILHNLGNIRILQFFYHTSQLVFFMIPAGHLSVISSQLSSLELCVLYNIHGQEAVDTRIKQMMAERKREVEENNPNKNNPKQSERGGLVLNIPRIPSVEDVVSYVVGGFVKTVSQLNTNQKKPSSDQYRGTVVWDKMRFIITKIDEVFQQQKGKRFNLEEQFYELGRLLGKNLKYLEPPTFPHCLAISLPEYQQIYPPNTGNLDDLLDLIKSLNSESNYHRRIEMAIRRMCNELRPVIQSSWAHFLLQWKDNHLSAIAKFEERSEMREKERSKG